MEKIDKNLYDAVIVGGGPSGLSAAIYLARACYKVLVLEKEKFGGQINETSEIVNYPGIEPQSGEELTKKMKKQAEYFGAEFMIAKALSFDLDQDIKTVHTSKGDFSCFAILIATGAHPRMIGFKNEDVYKGRGVAYCAICDGEFFTNKEVFVVGGGFAAAEESVFLTKFASKVTLLIREDDFTCAKSVSDKTRANDKINILTNTEVVSVDGDEMIRTITYKNNVTKKVTTYSPPDNSNIGVFVFAGYIPSNELVKDIVELSPLGYVLVDENNMTSKDGIFASGDLLDKKLRQVVTATSDGAVAATSMEKYLSEKREKTGIIPKIKKDTLNIKEDDVKKEKLVSKSKSTILDDDMIEKLKTVFSRLTTKLILEVCTNSSDISKELSMYMNEIVSLTDMITIKDKVISDDNIPYVTVLDGNEKSVGFTFHGVPGGHEFTSFILSLYNAGSKGQEISKDANKKIDNIDRDIDVKVLVSLSCTMCPDLVTALGRIVTLSPRVKADIYDIKYFSTLRDKYNVMSVPCFIINEKEVHFGKKNVDELLKILLK